MQQLSAVRIAVGPALAMMAAAATAHVPFLEESDYTLERPYVVHDVANSKSIHARIGVPGDVDVYQIDLDRPVRIYTQTNVPWCPQYAGFRITYALAGPGLPAPAVPLPVALPPGHGAIVVRDDARGDRPTWDEPFSGRRMWVGPDQSVDDPQPGTWRMIVWNERGETGDYIAVIGEAEIFNAPELAQVAATSPKLRRGANLMVRCDPTVVPPRAGSGANAD